MSKKKQQTILCIGDSHFGVRARGEQCLAAHEWFADLVEKEKPDLVLHSGDVFDVWSRPEDRRVVADWMTRLAEVCPVVVAKGGGIHDRRDDAAIMARLRTDHPVIVQQEAGIHHVAGITVAAMAWPEPAWLASASGASGVELDELVRDQMRNLLRGLGASLQGNSPSVFLAHLLVDGSKISNGQELVGAALNVGLADLALAGADAYVLGHIHLAQQWDLDGAPCLYTGSPFPKTWGETERKSITLLRWNGRRFAVDRVNTPSAALVHLDASWDGTALVLDDDTDVDGAECRLRYRFPADERDGAERAAQELRDDLLQQWGALSVRLEPVVEVTSRARAPEVARARTLAEQLEAYWRSIDFDPAERRQPLLGKLAELEQQ